MTISGTLSGMWRSRGYGWVVRAGQDVAGGVQWYDDSPIGLIPVPAPGGGAPSAGLEDAGDHLRYGDPGSLGTIRLDRTDVKLPEIARDVRDDPRANFEVLWSTVRDHHAFLESRGVDWEVVGHRLRPRARSATSDGELYAVLREALDALGDGHVGLDVPTAPPGEPTPGLAATRSWISTVALETRVFGRGQLVAGSLDTRTGFLGIMRMERFAADPDDPAAEVAAAGAAVGEALEWLEGFPGLVVDLRGNTGGWDVVALALLAPFVDQPRPAFTKCARWGSGTTEPEAVVVETGPGRRFTGPVALLTGPLTTSAAEVFTLASTVLPQVVRVGSPTRGILSDELEKHLPNGWTFTLSNEVYRDLEGVCPEVDGVVPDVLVEGDAGPTVERALDRGLSVAVRALRHGPGIAAASRG